MAMDKLAKSLQEPLFGKATHAHHAGEGDGKTGEGSADENKADAKEVASYLESVGLDADVISPEFAQEVSDKMNSKGTDKVLASIKGDRMYVIGGGSVGITHDGSGYVRETDEGAKTQVSEKQARIEITMGRIDGESGSYLQRGKTLDS